MRISATDLEALRIYCQDGWMRKRDLIDQLLGRTEVTEQMRRGIAFENCINQFCGLDDDPVSWDGFRFALETVLEVQQSLPHDRVEQPKVEMDIDGHTVVAKADYLSGVVLYDLKTTASQILGNKYSKSLQWRAYLLAFGAEMFVYDIVQLGSKRGEGVLYGKNHAQLVYYPYAGMDKDIEKWVRKFVPFKEKLESEQER